MSLIFRILGCGSSAGVPRVALGWGVCDPRNPKNRRRRCSLLIERHGPKGVTRVLIDTSADLRAQILDAETPALDAVLYTHSHADHIHGIDDLRSFVLQSETLLDAWMDAPTSAVIKRGFGYLFESPPGSLYAPVLRERRLAPGELVTVDGAGGPISALPFLLDHGEISALGFRFGDVAYSPDLVRIPDESLSALANLDLWIVDALRYKKHPTHFCVADALEWIARLKPGRAVLTNLSSEVDFETLDNETPENVEPAYDGMTFESLG